MRKKCVIADASIEIDEPPSPPTAYVAAYRDTVGYNKAALSSFDYPRVQKCRKFLAAFANCIFYYVCRVGRTDVRDTVSE